MENIHEEWSPEDVAAVDSALKRLGNSHEIALSIDRLFFALDEPHVVRNLKDAGGVLMRVKGEMPDDVQKKWTAALGRQLRFSVDRAKKNAGKA